MKQDLISALRLDIENAEKFFNRTGEGIKEAYKCIDKNIDTVDPVSGTQNVFLYIPESDDDMYVLHLN
jgi:hypothetical protein